MTEVPPSEPVSAPATEENAPVEIHKIKPIHSWRDFGKELGTIVLGIIIAISLEHLVESWQWDREVKEARQAILAEISANNDNVFTFRIALSPCLNRQLAEADAILASLEAGRDPQKFTSFNRPAITLLRDGEWQAERASQVLTHFPRAELALMSRYYAQLPDFHNWGNQEEDAWRRLAALEERPKGLTSSDLVRLRADLRTAKDVEFLIVSNSQRLQRVTAQIGIANPAADPVRLKNWCTMNVDDYRRYRSSQNLR